MKAGHGGWKGGARAGAARGAARRRKKRPFLLAPQCAQSWPITANLSTCPLWPGVDPCVPRQRSLRLQRSSSRWPARVCHRSGVQDRLIGEGNRRFRMRSAEAPPGGVKDGGTHTRSWEKTGKGSPPRGENPWKQGSRASRKAKCGEGESLTDGSVGARTRGNARRAKGPCRRQSEQRSEARAG
jgi:hypothetical protein